jgi:protein MBA1
VSAYPPTGEPRQSPPDPSRKFINPNPRGDVDTIRRICADGLNENLKTRIAARGRERLSWTLHKYIKSARVVSHCAGTLPIDGAGIRQAVVRVQSTQSLARFTADGKAIPGTGNERDLKEYVVIQKMMWDGKEGPWIIWGTTEETTRGFPFPVDRL